MEILVVMARAPRPGRAKTRLIPALGREGSARLCEALVLDTLQLAKRSAISTIIYTAGGDLRAFRRAAPDRAKWRAQSAGDLGRRMEAAFAGAFRSGGRRVVMIGTDSPGLPLRFVKSAFRALRAVDAVVGPTLDGGYYLIGLSRPMPALLHGMPWSTPALLTATAERARTLGARLGVLPPWFDVDEPRDLELVRGLAATGSLRPRPLHTLRALAGLPSLNRKEPA